MAHHWLAELKMYVRPSVTARMSKVRMFPLGRAGGISGAISGHPASERLLVWRTPARA
jgi:hypothetical protein